MVVGAPPRVIDHTGAFFEKVLLGAARSRKAVLFLRGVNHPTSTCTCIPVSCSGPCGCRECGRLTHPAERRWAAARALNVRARFQRTNGVVFEEERGGAEYRTGRLAIHNSQGQRSRVVVVF